MNPTTNKAMFRFRSRRRARRGATIVEMAIVLLTFLTLVLGMLDLALGVSRYNCLAHAARQGARQAIVHGSMADPDRDMNPWGVATVGPFPVNTDDHEIAAFIRPTLVHFDLTEVEVTVTWLENNNQFGKSVQVTVTAPYHPMMTFIFGNPTITLSASSTMAIAH